MDKTKFCIIAVSPNSWGRGKTIKEALKNLVAAGGKSKDAQMRFIAGDDRAYVNDMGDLMLAPDATSYKLTEK